MYDTPDGGSRFAVTHLALSTLARCDVVRLENQVEFTWIDVDCTLHSHFFDFRVTLWDGRRLALIVKRFTTAQKPAFAENAARIASQVPPSFADQVLVVTDEALGDFASRRVV